jgi:hypothetical protein
VRTYKRRSTYRRTRQDRAAELHAGGLSLRMIAAELHVSYETVRRDLAAWDARHAGVSHLPVTKVTPGGDFCDTRCDSPGGAVVPLRRTS